MSNYIKYRRIILISAITILLTSCYIGEHKGIILQNYSGDRLPPHEESTLKFRRSLDVQVDGKGFKEMTIIKPGWGDTTGQFIVQDGAIVLRPGIYEIKSIKRDKTHDGHWMRGDAYHCGTVELRPGNKYIIQYDVGKCIQKEITVNQYGRKVSERCRRHVVKCVVRRIVW